MLPDPRGSLLALARRAVGLLALALLALAGAEFGARIDDWMFLGVSPLASPTSESALRLADDGFVRGRPNGRFKRWQLNEHGFNGPPNALLPSPGCQRLVLLGASETFGSFESPGHEFATELRRRLPDEPCFEVVNASIAGMSVRSAAAYWKGWVERFRPDLVLIYANPMLGLPLTDGATGSCAPPRSAPAGGTAPPVTAAAPPPGAGGFSSRFLDRLRDAIEQPAWLVDAELRWNIARQVHDHAPGWEIEALSADCAAAFAAAVEALAQDVAASGALPIVSTHAFRRDHEPEPSQLWMRRWIPRVTGPALARYHEQANDSLRALGAGPSLDVFDADALLRNCAACFADPFHFSDAGAERLASAFASYVVQLPERDEHALQ